MDESQFGVIICGQEPPKTSFLFYVFRIQFDFRDTFIACNINLSEKCSMKDVVET